MRKTIPLLLLGPWLLAAEPGQTAPAIDGVVWVNVGKAKPAARGKLTLLLFWSPDNPQSTMAFPRLQDLHEVCGDLQVLTVCRDDETKVRELLDRNDYTVAAGTDVGKAAAQAYGLSGWPDTFLIDRSGKITWRGDPFRAATEAWKAVGIEDPAGATILQLAKAHRAKKKDQLLFLYSVMAASGSARMELGKWARSVIGEGAGNPAADPAALLRAYVEGDEAALPQLRDVKQFNLAGWARARRAELLPLTPAEVKELVQGRRYGMLLDALVERGSPSLAATAARDKAFAEHCRARADARLLHAKKALMAYHWWIQGKVPQDTKAFSREISVQTWQEDDGGKLTGIQIGAQYIDGAEMEAYALKCATQSLLMQAAGKGQGPPADLGKRAEAEVARILAELRAKYG